MQYGRYIYKSAVLCTLVVKIDVENGRWHLKWLIYEYWIFVRKLDQPLEMPTPIPYLSGQPTCKPQYMYSQ